MNMKLAVRSGLLTVAFIAITILLLPSYGKLPLAAAGVWLNGLSGLIWALICALDIATIRQERTGSGNE